MKRWVKLSVFSEMKQNHHGINERRWCARHCESMHKLPPSSAMKLQVCLTIFHEWANHASLKTTLHRNVVKGRVKLVFRGISEFSAALGSECKMGDGRGSVVCLKPQGWMGNIWEASGVTYLLHFPACYDWLLREERGNNFAVKVFDSEGLWEVWKETSWRCWIKSQMALS